MARLKQRSYASASRLARQACEVAPNSRFGWAALYTVCQGRGDIDCTVEALQRLADLNRDLGESPHREYFELAYLRSLAGDYDRAIEAGCFVESADDNSEYLPVESALAHAYASVGDVTSAEVYFQRAMLIDVPSLWERWLGLFSDLPSGRIHTAEHEVCTLAADRCDGDVLRLTTLALMFYQMGLPKDARLAQNRAIALNEADPFVQSVEAEFRASASADPAA